MPNGDIAQCRNERCAGGDTGGGAILGDRALREMDVDILILVEGVFDLVMLRDRTDVGDGSRYRFLHHIAQRAGGDGFAGTGDDRGFHLEELAAHGSPGQPIDKADAVLLGDDILGDVAGAQVIGQVSGLNGNLFGGFAGYHLGSDLAAKGGQTALQGTHAGFPGIVIDDIIDGAIGHGNLPDGKAVAFPLLGQQMAFGDLELFFPGVAWQLDDLHAVQQGGRNGTAVIGRGDEEHMGKVERHLDIMIPEGAVLLGIQYLQQGGGRIAAVIIAELIYLIQQQHGIGAAGLLDGIDDTTGHTAYISFPMAADLGFIFDTAQRDTSIAASHRLRDAAYDGGFAHAGRAHKAEDLTIDIRRKRPNSQSFQYTLLDLLEAVVLLIEELGSLFEIYHIFGIAAPGQL